MVKQDYIEVKIVSEKRALQDLGDPDGVVPPSNTHVKYIEVSTGAKFGVQIRLWPGFNFYEADCVYYRIYIDEADMYHFGEIANTSQDAPNGKASKHISRLRDNTDFYDEKTGRTENASYVFGVLSMVDHMNEHTKVDPKSLANLGSIRVQVFRAKRRKIVPHHLAALPLVRDEISEKVFKGKSLKNNIKFIDKQEVKGHMIDKDYDPISGDNGKIYKFNFHYRTKKILQSLGVLPRTPSPPVDHNILLQRTDAMMENMKVEADDRGRRDQREIEALRAQINELKRSNGNGSPYPPTPRTSRDPSIMHEVFRDVQDRTPREVKKEPIDVEAPIIRPDSSRDIIDLTEDTPPPVLKIAALTSRKRDGSPIEISEQSKRARFGSYAPPSPAIPTRKRGRSPNDSSDKSKRVRYESIADDDERMSDSTVHYHVPPAQRSLPKRKRDLESEETEHPAKRSQM